MIRTFIAVLLTMPLGGASLAEVVLLQSGAVLEGAVEQSADGLILQKQGNVIQLRSSEVALVSNSQIEAYEWLRKRANGSRSPAEEHLSLADWCLQNDMALQAARELLDSRQIDPHSPRLALLERRLDEMIRPTKATLSSSKAALDRPQAPIEEEAPLHKMPQGGLPHFTRRVQPVLLNGCAAAKCHGGKENLGNFTLNRSPLYGHGNARITNSNLRAILTEINFDDPKSSRLLAALQGPHAGTRPLSGPRRQELLSRIENWVTAVAAANSKPSPAPPQQDQHEVVQAPVNAVERTNGSTATEVEFTAERSHAPPIRGTQLKRVTARDEFDPAIFNSRYRESAPSMN